MGAGFNIFGGRRPEIKEDDVPPSPIETQDEIDTQITEGVNNPVVDELIEQQIQRQEPPTQAILGEVADIEDQVTVV